MTEQDEGVTVVVRRHPNDWQYGICRLDSLWGLHWGYHSGGVVRATRHKTLFAYMACDSLIAGEVAHTCSHGPPPHAIKVCLPKTSNKIEWKEIMAAMEREAERRRPPPRR